MCLKSPLVSPLMLSELASVSPLMLSELAYNASTSPPKVTLFFSFHFLYSPSPLTPPPPTPLFHIPSPFSPSLISLMVPVDVKHPVHVLANCPICPKLDYQDYMEATYSRSTHVNTGRVRLRFTKEKKEVLCPFQ